MNVTSKTLLTLALGLIAAGADHLLSSVVPTGGFAQTLNSQPALALVFATGVVYAHNYFTKMEIAAGIAAPAPASSGTTKPGA